MANRTSRLTLPFSSSFWLEISPSLSMDSQTQGLVISFKYLAFPAPVHPPVTWVTGRAGPCLLTLAMVFIQVPERTTSPIQSAIAS